MNAQQLDVFDDAEEIEAMTAVRPTPAPLLRDAHRGPIGAAVAALRREAGITAAELATRIGWSRATIVKLENGHSVPSSRLVDAIAAAFGVHAGPLHEVAEAARVLQGVSRDEANRLDDAQRYRPPEPLTDDTRLPRHPEMPVTRGDCKEGPRPCPWYGCRHHLGLDTDSRGQIFVVVPEDRLVAHDGPTCALDVAEETGGLTLQEVGDIVGVTRERVRQIQCRALEKLRKRAPELLELLERDAPIPTTDAWSLL